MAEKEDSVHHVLNTLARRGDPSSLRASASLALMLGDDSTEERIRRFHEKMEVKKTMNTIDTVQNVTRENEKEALNPDVIEIDI